MIISKGSTEDYITQNSYLTIKDKNEQFLLSALMKRLITEQPFLYSIEIETINRCNNDCPFCPVNVHDDIRERKVMDEKLFRKIIDELSEVNYSGYISLFSNNEPLLVCGIYDFLVYAKEKLPLATHALYTNGTLLNKKKYKKLTENLNYLVIDNYNDDMILNENIQEIYEDASINDNGCVVNVAIRKKHQILSTRGSISPNRKDINEFYSPCILPFLHMVVRPDGKVSRCCNDAYGLDTLGDLSKETIKEVWYGNRYQTYRKLMSDNKRNQIDRCENCDFFGMINYYPSEWLQYYLMSFLELLYQKKKERRKIKLLNTMHDSELNNFLKFYGIVPIQMVSSDRLRELNDGSYYVLDEYDYETLLQLEEQGLRIIEDYIVCPVSQIWGGNRDKNLKTVSETQKRVQKVSESDKLVVFGAGGTAREIITRLHLKPKLLVDNDVNKVGKKMLGIEIWSPDKVCWDGVEVVVATCRYETVDQLVDLGVSRNRIVMCEELDGM